MAHTFTERMFQSEIAGVESRFDNIQILPRDDQFEARRRGLLDVGRMGARATMEVRLKV
jgi:hypothetical protein